MYNVADLSQPNQMKKLNLQSFFFLFILVSCLPRWSFADEPNDFLVKAFEQSNVWLHGPLQINARLHLSKPKGGDLDLDYVLYWAAPDKWRVEWSGSGYTEKAVLTEGKLYRLRNAPVPPIQELAFNDMLGLALGNRSVAPFYNTWPLSDPKFSKQAKVSKDEFRGIQLECFSEPGARACVDPKTSQIAEYESDMIISVFEGYASLDGVVYPQALRMLTSEGKPIADVSLSITRQAKFEDSLFDPIPDSVVVEYAPCPNLDGSVIASSVQHPVWPRHPRTSSTGTVWVYASVAADGSPLKVEAYPGSASDLSARAVDTVRHWKFTPVNRCGKSVASEELIPLTFGFRYQ